MAGERRKLARIDALVEGEEDEAEAGRVAEPVEQGLQRADIFAGDRNVGAHVAAEAGEQGGVVVAQRARMELHHHPVLDAHPRHFGQHLAAEQSRPRRA